MNTEGIMVLSLIKYTYRVLAITVITLPVILNVIYPSSIVSSLIYIPLLSLALTMLLVYLEKQLLLAYLLVNQRLKIRKQFNVQKKIEEKRPFQKPCESNNLSK
jgi:hypothetical protein